MKVFKKIWEVILVLGVLLLAFYLFKCTGNLVSTFWYYISPGSTNVGIALLDLLGMLLTWLLGLSLIIVDAFIMIYISDYSIDDKSE